MSIPFVDLKSQFSSMESEIRTAIDRVLAHGKFIMGPEVLELEQELAAYCGAAHAITCSSGTDALLMALMSQGIGPGDAVFTTPFTFVATAEVISLLGATPVFVDIEPDTFNISPVLLKDEIEAVLHGSVLTPKAVIAVDLFGLPADYDAINAVAREHQLIVVEDAAQSFGASYKGTKSCNLTDIAATSFFPAKPLGCYGDGGAVFTNDVDIAARLRSIRVHGKGSDKYDNVRIGLNARLDTLQAAILKVKLKYFDAELVQRAAAATRYTELIDNAYIKPLLPDQCTSAWAQYSLLHDDRDQVKRKLSAAGIPAQVYYPKPLHLSDAFSVLDYSAGRFPAAESCAKRILSIPMHPYLSDDDIALVATQLNHAASES